MVLVVASRGGAYGGRRYLPMQLDISWGYGGLAWVHPLELAKELTIIIVFPVQDDEVEFERDSPHEKKRTTPYTYTLFWVIE